MSELISRMYEDLRVRGIVSQLDQGEIPAAVFWPTVKDEQSIRKLGQALLGWMQSHEGVSRILGLERMLEGKLPEVASCVLEIPIWGRPSSWTMHVALAVWKHGADEEKLAASLCKLIDESGVAMVESFEQYGYMTR